MSFIRKLTNCARAVQFFGMMVILFATVFLFAACSTEVVTWQTDYDTALALAQEQDKNIFLIFTGLAWDSVSPILKTDVLDTDEFKKNVGKKYILLHIDVPKNDGSMPNDADMKKHELAWSFGVQVAPVALLVTQGGQPFAYLPIMTSDSSITTPDLLSFTTEIKQPADLIALVNTENANARKITSLYKKMESSEGTDRVNAIDAYVNALPEQLITSLSPLYAEVLKLDPENLTGLLGKYKLLVAKESASYAFAMNDTDTALSSFLVLVDEPHLLTALGKQEAYYLIAYYAAQGGTVPQEEVIAYLQQAYNVAPDSITAPDILLTIEKLGASE